MILNLAANHAEYWKATQRDGYTIGFHWFPTFPSSRRLRFPWGLNKPVKLGWETGWDREVEQLDEGSTWLLSDRRHGFWVRCFGDLTIPFGNERKHFDKEGNEIA